MGRCFNALASWNAAISACRKEARWQAALALLSSASSVTRRVRVQPDAVTFTACAKVCEAAWRWQHAIHLLSHFDDADPTTCSTWISAAGRSQSWSQVHKVLDHPRLGHWRFQLIVCGAAIAAAARTAQWSAALAMLDSAHAAGISQDEIGYSAAMHSCVKARRWHLALDLFAALGMQRLDGSSQVVVNPAISACEAGHQWQLALALFTGIGGAIQADSLNAAASACSKGYHWQQALTLIGTSLERRVRPSTLTMVVALAASASGSQWEAAIHWIGYAWRHHRSANTDTACVNSALSACARAKQWERVLDLLTSPWQKDAVSYLTSMEVCNALWLLQDARRNRIDLSGHALMMSKISKSGFVTSHLLDGCSLEDLCGLWEVDEQRCSTSLRSSKLWPLWSRHLEHPLLSLLREPTPTGRYGEVRVPCAATRRIAEQLTKRSLVILAFDDLYPYKII